MKTLTLSSAKQFLAAGLLAVALTLATTGYAGLQIPYTPDASTLHLYHLDDPNSGVVVTDAVVVASITLTNQAQTNVPGSTITLGNASAFPQLNTCLHITATNFSAGNNYAFANNREFFPDTTPFRNSTSGAFTFEALVKLDGSPAIVGNGNWEIVCGDNSPGGGQSRGWQFRIQSGATPTFNFNFITGGGGNYTVPMPTTGPNAVTPGQWYHVAVTYTGNSPTNTDTAGVMIFYWTLLDPGRTHADAAYVTNTAGTFTLGGTPNLGVGGNCRNNNGVANNEGLKGYIDEVRISDVARASNEMAFVTGGALSPPNFVQQPPSNTFIGYGQTLTLSALVSGAPTPTLRWQQDGTDVPGQTDSTLIINNATFAAGGNYWLIASNSLQVKTSTLAQVTIGAAFSELFNTGQADDRSLPVGGTVDPHYILSQSADPNLLGPNTLMWDMGAYPVLPAGIFALVGGPSQWIGPNWNSGGATYTSPQGTYVYRTTFLIDSVDLNQPVALHGVWWENTTGSDILLNGVSTGLSTGNTNFPNIAYTFDITTGFVPGINTIEFITPCVNPNGSYPESAVRIELSGLGSALAPAKPDILVQPANQTVRDGSIAPGSVATFSVVARGRPPLSYQWWGDGTLIPGATNRTLKFVSPTPGAQSNTFQVVVGNDSGSVTSAPAAVLTLTTNQFPIAPAYNFTVYSNNTLNVNLSTIYHACSDPDGDPLTIGYDAFSTNFGTIIPNGIFLTYAPPPDYTGSDEFTYNISDGLTIVTSPIHITILPLLLPTVTFSVSGSDLTLNGAGGAPGGSYTVLATSDLTVPVANWTPVNIGTFNGGGAFSVTVPIQSNVPQRFFIIRVP